MRTKEVGRTENWWKTEKRKVTGRCDFKGWKRKRFAREWEWKNEKVRVIEIQKDWECKPKRQWKKDTRQIKKDQEREKKYLAKK